MHLFRDEIVPEVETSDNAHHSDMDKDYNPEMEKDISDDHDLEVRADKEDDDPHVRHEKLAEEAPPYPSEIEIVPMDVPTTTTSVGSKKRKGRSPMKSLKVTESMHLEYNASVNPVANGVGNIENKSAYVSVRFPYCTHGMRFQRV